MNKVRLFLFFFFLIHIPTFVYSQINWGDYSQSFPGGAEALDKPSTIALILAIPKENNSFWTIRNNSARFEEFEKDTSFKEFRPNIIARTTFDTARAQFFLHGVNMKNALLYQFHVIEYPSRKVIMPWQSITHFTDATVIKDSGLPQMAYLGGYNAPLGSMLIVDVRKKETSTIIASSLVAWEIIRPTVSNIYTSDDLDIFLQKLQYPWAKAKTNYKAKYSLDNLRLSATNTNLIYVLNADIYSKNQVQYQLLRNNKVIRVWGDNEYDNSFIWLKDFSPGQYQIQIRYTAQPQHITIYRFEVEPNWYQTFWFKLVVTGVSIIIIALFVFVFLLIRQRSRTRQETAKKQKLHLELQALYAQLNPHFVFNALTSIQGLINQHDVKGANEYLSDFARLMRESLTNGSKEETPLWQELQMMETYLRLEQLRFGFSYTIQIDEQLDLYSNNLPSLLWQPLLENAVKHGVASLQQTGQITIRLEKIDNTMVMSIADNGKGIIISESTDGFGLKLTRNRIRLLNDLNPEQPISLVLNNSLPVGTEVTLTFTHWLL